MANPAPLVENVHVSAVADGKYDSRLEPSAQLPIFSTRRRSEMRRRWLFHHPDDKSVVGVDLPEPQESEMQISGADDFGEMGERMRAKSRP